MAPGHAQRTKIYSDLDFLLDFEQRKKNSDSGIVKLSDLNFNIWKKTQLDYGRRLSWISEYTFFWSGLRNKRIYEIFFAVEK